MRHFDVWNPTPCSYINKHFALCHCPCLDCSPNNGTVWNTACQLSIAQLPACLPPLCSAETQTETCEYFQIRLRPLERFVRWLWCHFCVISSGAQLCTGVNIRLDNVPTDCVTVLTRQLSERQRLPPIPTPTDRPIKYGHSPKCTIAVALDYMTPPSGRYGCGLIHANKLASFSLAEHWFTSRAMYVTVVTTAVAKWFRLILPLFEDKTGLVRWMHEQPRTAINSSEGKYWYFKNEWRHSCHDNCCLVHASNASRTCHIKLSWVLFICVLFLSIMNNNVFDKNEDFFLFHHNV